MRQSLDEAKLLTFMDEVGRLAKSPGRIYLVGGATALLLGVREQTIDLDMKLEPEPGGIFEAIGMLKEKLSINVELASPDQFLPALPGWESRSEFIGTHGQVSFFHYDFYGQALSKILRGHKQDVADVRALLDLGKIAVDKLVFLFEQVLPEMKRYPAIDEVSFRNQLRAFVEESKR